MKSELIKQIEETERFFEDSQEGQKLDAIEEMFYNLIQTIDVRENSIVVSNILDRLSSLTETKHDGYDQFSQEYFYHTGAFISGYMHLFIDQLEKSTDVEQVLMEAMETLEEKLSDDRKDEIASSLLREFISKIKLLEDNEELKDNPLVQEMVQSFVLDDSCIDEFLKVGALETIGLLLGVIASIYAVEHDGSMEFESFDEEEGAVA